MKAWIASTRALAQSSKSCGRPRRGIDAIVLATLFSPSLRVGEAAEIILLCKSSGVDRVDNVDPATDYAPELWESNFPLFPVVLDLDSVSRIHLASVPGRPDVGSHEERNSSWIREIHDDAFSLGIFATELECEPRAPASG
jgi:hypothetical protein